MLSEVEYLGKFWVSLRSVLKGELFFMIKEVVFMVRGVSLDFFNGLILVIFFLLFRIILEVLMGFCVLFWVFVVFVFLLLMIM